MRHRTHKTKGLTLIEMTLVVATIALLVGFGVPAVRALVNSFHSESGVRSVVNAALSSARAMAVQRQSYVGIRFQMSGYSGTADAEGILSAPQYIIFIVHDPERAPHGTEYVNGFRAIEGIEPIKLPDTFAATDLTWVERTAGNPVTFIEHPADAALDNTSERSLFPARLRDMTTFSIVFSPAGKLVVHEVRVWNRHGRRPGDATQSTDDVFNTSAQVANMDVRAMFVQDEFPPETGLGPESSRTSFVIFERTELRQAYRRGVPWAGCLQGLATERVYVSPYTGELIASD